MKIFFKNITLIFLISTCCFVLAGFFHAIHIAYGESEILQYGFTGKITFNKPDFFYSLKHFYGASFSGFTDKQFDDIKLEYISDHFIVKINGGQQLRLIISGNGEDDSSIWFEFKFSSFDKINRLEIRNDALMKEFSDQLNLLNIKTASGEESKIFSKSSPEAQINF